MGKTLYGHAVKENVEYEWKSEPGACDVCQGMSGAVYDSANDIPDRPHPNCKCWIDILEKEMDETITDPIEIRREEYKDKKRNELELAKLLGDAKSLEQEIDEYINRIDGQDKEIERLENTIDTSQLEPKDKQKISEAKEKIDYAKYRGDKAKQDVTTLKIEISKTGGSIQEISKLEFELQKLRENLDNMGKILMDKSIELAGIFTSMQESAALWKLSTSKFKEGLDYIDKNGKIFDKMDDIKNDKVRDFVKKKVEEQLRTKESRGVVFYSDSSLANKIVDSNAMKKYIADNKSKFKPDSTHANTSLDFGLLNIDMYNALHKADIIDIKIEKDGTLTAKVIDTYDFNKNSQNPLVKAGGHYQENGKIENYYSITLIKIPQSVWSKY